MGEVHSEPKIRWTFFKISMTLLLFGLGGAGIYLSIKPLIEGEYEPKSFANLFFTAMMLFYMLSFLRVYSTMQFIFWSTSFSIAITAAIMFLYYEDLFS